MLSGTQSANLLQHHLWRRLVHF